VKNEREKSLKRSNEIVVLEILFFITKEGEE
jgi:hypothetical protein